MSASEQLYRDAMAQLDQLLTKPPVERDALLQNLSQAQPALHALVMQLLDAERQASGSGFLEIATLKSAPSIQPDQRIGDYRIVRKLGEGGMGQVWLARRDDGMYESNVAIKTLHPHLANTQLRERFTREAHILGKLAHKNIARLLDAGVSDEGIAYLVLEYVQGESLDMWCDARSLSVKERLELFLSACRAVAHAHAHLVVHRDLKPSNILVAHNGAVKLLDFGVAKLVQAEDSMAESTALTQFGGRIFTPVYAAPEQILGEPVTTATDVYALGVVLYVLLSGKRPFGGVTTTGRELEHAILHNEPAALSYLPGDEAATIASARATTPAKLQRALAGDLEFIVARALRKSPKDRYGSVLALAVDVERYLQQQPIEARAGSSAYRVGRLLQRHRAATLATAVSLLSLLVGTGLALWQAQVARVEARKANAVKDFLVGIFERNSAAHPEGARARQSTAEELLAQSSRAIQTELQDAPEVRAEMLGVMSGLYSSLDLQREAIELRLSQLQLARDTFGKESVEVARLLAALAHSQHQFGDYDAARSNAEQSVRMFEQLRDTSSLDLAKAHHILANIDQRQGRTDESMMRRLELALDIVEQHHPRDPERVEVLMSFARAATLRNEPEESLRYGEQALRLIQSDSVKVSGMERGALHQVMSVRLRNVYRYDEALEMIGRATEEFERAGGPDHPFTIDSRREHGLLLNLLGRRLEGVTLIAQSVAGLERTKGADDLELTANARVILAQVQIVRGDFVAAEPQIAHAIRVVEGRNPVLLTAARVMLARMQTAQGKFEATARTLDGLEAASIGISGERSLRHALALTRLGQFELARGRLSDAERHFAQLFSWPEPAGAMSSGRANAGVGLIRIALERGEVDSALAQARAVFAGIEASKERPIMKDPEADVRMLLGAALTLSGDATTGKPHLEWAVTTREAMDHENSPWLAEARLYFAQCLLRLGQREMARAQLTAANQAIRSHPALAPPFTALLRRTAGLF